MRGRKREQEKQTGIRCKGWIVENEGFCMTRAVQEWVLQTWGLGREGENIGSPA